MCFKEPLYKEGVLCINILLLKSTLLIAIHYIIMWAGPRAHIKKGACKSESNMADVYSNKETAQDTVYKTIIKLYEAGPL